MLSRLARVVDRLAELGGLLLHLRGLGHGVVLYFLEVLLALFGFHVASVVGLVAGYPAGGWRNRRIARRVHRLISGASPRAWTPRAQSRLREPGAVRVRRALLSVSDKRGIVEFARGLTELEVEIISTGGTAQELAEAGLEVRAIEDFTGFPEIWTGG